MPPQNSKHYHVPFGNDANFVNHPGVAAIKIQKKSELPPRPAVFLQLLARLARHPFAFTSMCGTDTAGRRALEPPPEGGARTKIYSTENSSSANRMLRPRRKTSDQIHDTTELFYICLYFFCRAPSSSEGWLWRQQVWGYLHFSASSLMDASRVHPTMVSGLVGRSRAA